MTTSKVESHSIHYGITFLLLGYAAAALYVLILFDGTGDAGDSIHHYLFAAYAGRHPELFLDHWAKPLYVLMVFPFAQLGFTGVKVFNALTTLSTVYLTYRIAIRLNFKNALVAAMCVAAMPLGFILTLSGLTEPLFALMLAIGTYLCCEKKFGLAAFVISCTPFVRSEGLIILGVFAVYFFIQREYRAIPLLAVGHLFYSAAGFFFYKDVFWVFNKIPYARPDSIYGSGSLDHFVIQLYYVTGLPIYCLLLIGLFAALWLTIKTFPANAEISILILAGFVAFFVAHTCFWYFGIFNSMGLKRVFIGVSPWIGLLALTGFNALTSLVQPRKKMYMVLCTSIVGYVLVFPFTPNRAAIKVADLKLSDEQILAKQAATFISSIKNKKRLVYYAPYFSEILHIDHFDSEVRLELTRKNLELLRTGDIIIWDDWYAPLDGEVPETRLSSDTTLIHLKTYKKITNEREIVYSVFEKVKA